MLKLYKNKNFTKRDYECTNVVYCIANSAPNHNWVETVEDVQGSHLFTENGVQYYGWL